MSDTFLREREDHVGVSHPEPEQRIYTAYVTVRTEPLIRADAPLYDVAEDGSVTLVDTSPAPLEVTTEDDGSVTIKVPE